MRSPLVKADPCFWVCTVLTLSSYPPEILAKILTGVREKTPTPLGPPCTDVSALGALVTAADGAVASAETSTVLVEDDVEVVDELVLELLVETASWAWEISGTRARKNSANSRMDKYLISRKPSGSSLG